jgi:virginiamycin B lyase
VRVHGLGMAALAAAFIVSVPPTSGSSGLPEPVDIATAGAAPIAVGATPSWAQVAGGSAWIATDAGLVQLDGATGESVGTTALPGRVCAGMGAGEGSLWIGTCGDPVITRVDAATGAVQATIPMDVPTWLRDRSSVSVGEGSVWALSDGNEPLLVRIDPATNAVVDRFPVAVGSSALQAGLGAVWITNCDEEILLRIDPATGERVATIDVGYYPDALAIGEGSIWVVDQEDGTVSRVDPTTNTRVAVIPVSDVGIDGDIVVAGGSVWVHVNDALLAQIDPTTNAVVARYGPAAGHGSVAGDDKAVWVTAADPAAVWRLPLPLPPPASS